MYVVLTGFTDNAGSPEYNLGLARRRAESIEAYLVDNPLQSSNLNILTTCLITDGFYISVYYVTLLDGKWTLMVRWATSILATKS